MGPVSFRARAVWLVHAFTLVAWPLAAQPDPCAPAEASNAGCEFYALTLPNPLLDQSTFAFGIELDNAGAASVSVTITGGALQNTLPLLIAPASAAPVALPWVPALSTVGASGGPPATAIVTGGAYRILADGPLTAAQFNSFTAQQGALFSYTNDAALLLPVYAAGTEYRVAAWPTWNSGGGQLPGNIAVVATADATTVDVVATGPIQPGAGLGTSGGTVVLNTGDVLLVSSALDAPAGGYGSDLSGTLVTSTAPVLLWSGHAGSFVPQGFAYADHMEESVPPVRALATDYLVVRPWYPSGLSRHIVKVVGTQNGTLLVTTPPVALPPTLQAGEVATLDTTVDFRLHSTAPVLVMLFMVGSEAAPGALGDPAQTLAVPTAQARRSIDFLAPAGLAGATPISAQVVAPVGSTVTVDGTPVTGWAAIGSTNYAVAQVALCCSDRHRAESDRPLTLSVVTYPQYTSYWYAGGTGLASVLLLDGFEWGDASGWSSVAP